MTSQDFQSAIKNTTHMPLLGYFIGWNLCGGPVSQFHAQDLLERHGLTEEIPLPRVGPTTAYRRAVSQATRGKRTTKEFETVKISETVQSITHAIVRTETLNDSQTVRDGNGELVLRGDLNIDIEFRVGFDKVRREAKTFPPEDLVRFEDEAIGHPVAQKIMDLYTKLAVEYSVDDIRGGFQTAFDKSWGGFRALSQGAMWFLPVSMENKVRSWEALMKDLGHSPLVIPIFDSGQSKDQLRVLALNTLDGQLKEVKGQIAAFKMNANKTRVSTFESRLNALEDLKSKASIYKTLLGAEIEDLTTLITDAQDGLMDTLSTLETDAA